MRDSSVADRKCIPQGHLEIHTRYPELRTTYPWYFKALSKLVTISPPDIQEVRLGKEITVTAVDVKLVVKTLNAGKGLQWNSTWNAQSHESRNSLADSCVSAGLHGILEGHWKIGNLRPSSTRTKRGPGVNAPNAGAYHTLDSLAKCMSSALKKVPRNTVIELNLDDAQCVFDPSRSTT